MDERELYAVFHDSPLLLEATKIIITSPADGASVQQISDRLHKHPPAVYRALQRLVELELASTRRDGKSVIYTVNHDKFKVVLGIVADLWNPTTTQIVDELLRDPLNGVTVSRGVEVDGVAADHAFEVFAEITGRKPRRVAVDVFPEIHKKDAYGLLGYIAAVKNIDAYILLLTEHADGREVFNRVEGFLDDAKEKLNVPTTAVLIEKEDPTAAIRRARRTLDAALAVK